MIYFFFFLMIRRPPRSTLFPTRRSSDLPYQEEWLRCRAGRKLTRYPRNLSGSCCGLPLGQTSVIALVHYGKSSRSEEHTSELQSHSDLVCRLLLEKNN